MTPKLSMEGVWVQIIIALTRPTVDKFYMFSLALWVKKVFSLIGLS